MSQPLRAVVGPSGLSDAQLVTLLVGLALALLDVHADRNCHGAVHPAHIDLDGAGRPILLRSPAPSGWTPRDDVVALLRLGTSLASAGSTLSEQLRTCAAATDLSLTTLIPWLLNLGEPAPLLPS